MNIEKSTDRLLGTEMHHVVLSSGMNAYFLPLSPEVKVSMFHLFTKFGSIDARFRVPETGQEVEVEDGTAHFLEHCAFYDPEGNDAMQWFNRRGLSSNAWTSFDHTTYHFNSIGGNIRRNLEFLINFVTTPYFTDKVVAKEQGVIAQEVSKYKDEPDSVLEENLRLALLQKHPFRRSIAGDKDTILKITKEYLQTAYGTFYHPSNLNLVMLVPSQNPNEDAGKYFRLAEFICEKKGFEKKQAPSYIYTDEPAEPAQKRIVCAHKVAEPNVLIGFKGNISMKGSLEERQKIDLTNDLLANVIFSKSSEAVYELVQKGVVRKSSFGGYHYSGRGFGMFAAGGSTESPDLFVESFLKMIKNQANGGISKELFETIKKGSINSGAGMLELEPIRGVYPYESFAVHSLAAGFNPMDMMPALQEITYEDVMDAAKKYLNTENYAVSIIMPR